AQGAEVARHDQGALPSTGGASAPRRRRLARRARERALRVQPAELQLGHPRRGARGPRLLRAPDRPGPRAGGAPRAPDLARRPAAEGARGPRRAVQAAQLRPRRARARTDRRQAAAALVVLRPQAPALRVRGSPRRAAAALLLPETGRARPRLE